MSVKDIAKLGKLLGQFLANFACCFARPAGRALLLVYVQGLLSGVQRKNVEAIALDRSVAPRTLQRFLESMVWDEQRLRDRCQQFIASDHAHAEAIGCIDETGTAKSGTQTAGVKRQYNGNRGKIENCVNHVALAYSAPGFDCLLDARLSLPQRRGAQRRVVNAGTSPARRQRLRGIDWFAAPLSRTTLPSRGRPTDLPCPPKRAGFQVPSKDTKQNTRRTRYRPRKNQIRSPENATKLK